MELRKSEREFQTESDIFGEAQKRRHRIFGCWHLQMSRPRTIGNTTFAYCKKCGSRRKYDLARRKFEGSFYHPPLYVKGI